MGPFLKCDAPPEFIYETDRLERQSNECYQGVELLKCPQNLACWAALTRFIEIIESTIGEYGRFSPQMEADRCQVRFFLPTKCR